MAVDTLLRQPRGVLELFRRFRCDAAFSQEALNIYIPGGVDRTIQSERSERCAGGKKELLISELYVEEKPSDLIGICCETVRTEELGQHFIGQDKNELESQGRVFSPDDGKAVLAEKAPRREVFIIENILCVGIVKVALPGAVDAECAKGSDGTFRKIEPVKCF